MTIIELWPSPVLGPTRGEHVGIPPGFWIAAGLVVAAIVVALTVLQPTPQAADTSEPGPQLAGADPAMSEAG